MKWIIKFFASLRLNHFCKMFSFSEEEKSKMPPFHWGCRCVMVKI